jgi:hypothetical protein
VQSGRGRASPGPRWRRSGRRSLGRVRVPTVDAECTLQCFSRRKLTIWRLYWLQDAKLFGPTHAACGERQTVCENGAVAASSVGRGGQRMLLKLAMREPCVRWYLPPARSVWGSRDPTGQVRSSQTTTKESGNNNTATTRQTLHKTLYAIDVQLSVGLSLLLRCWISILPLRSPECHLPRRPWIWGRRFC